VEETIPFASTETLCAVKNPAPAVFVTPLPPPPVSER
jgi:hypothetical protein